MARDFFDVPRAPLQVGDGTCDLPILYRDGSLVGVFFRVDLARAREVVGPGAVEPWPVLGRAVAAIYAWEYRDSTIGSYGEVGLGVQCRRVGSRPSLLKLGVDMGAQDDQGIWVVSLPVTTQAAFEAGVSIWGYPKYVAPITTHFDADGATIELADELTLTAEPLRGPTLRGQPVVTYTARDVGPSARRVRRAPEPVSHGAR